MVNISQAQEVVRPQPKFWIGVTGAANFNFYSGTTQTLNSSVKAPTAFHKGFGVAPFGSVLLEYRPAPKFGIMLNVGYDDRSAKFDGVDAPCDCPATLKTKLAYITIQPSLKFTPFNSGLYFFAGGAYSINVKNDFTYTQEKQPDKSGEISDTKKGVFSTHIGAGYEIPLSSKENLTQVNLSPFISYHPYFGQEPRSVESWSLSTLRAGLSLKFGKAKEKAKTDASTETAVTPTAVSSDAGVQFSVRPPVTAQTKRTAKETFPLRNYVFFNEGSTEIPTRYVKLSREQAVTFKEASFQEPEPKDAEGRSDRQMTVYHNILNIVGDRMRKNPAITITLIGASAGKGIEMGKAEAESVKAYLVNVFEINGARIATEGRNQPLIPSEQPGGKIDLVLLRDGDRRVDIVSNSPELLAPLQIRAVQVNPLDSRIVFKAKASEKESMESWSIDVTDDKGKVQHFGPYTKEQESIAANTILGDRTSGKYKIVMSGKTKDGKQIRKESSINLVRNMEPKEEVVRFSVLFDFDKSQTVSTYEKFLTDVVAPAIKDSSTVIIHGHSDIIGDTEYNSNLSTDRALETEKIIKKSLENSGKKGVKYEVYGLGADEDFAPFENKLPEERFYNRTVIIDVVPNK
ncbi:MAG: outer membrane beta-barrel protein [Bacteroidota bacterium]|nr:outer membrane beta-barrel protein [Bacteroidota bacterium]